MNNACLITGTDTEVGKTYITCLLIKELRAKGINAIGFKPVSSGDRIDAKQLAAASEIDDINLINPYHFDIPVALTFYVTDSMSYNNSTITLSSKALVAGKLLIYQMEA